MTRTLSPLRDEQQQKQRRPVVAAASSSMTTTASPSPSSCTGRPHRRKRMAKRHAQVFERSRTFPISMDGRQHEMTVHAEGLLEGSKIVYLLDGILVGMQQYDSFPTSGKTLELDNHNIQVRATGDEWSKDRSLELTVDGSVVQSRESALTRGIESPPTQDDEEEQLAEITDYDFSESPEDEEDEDVSSSSYSTLDVAKAIASHSRHG